MDIVYLGIGYWELGIGFTICNHILDMFGYGGINTTNTRYVGIWGNKNKRVQTV